MPYPIAAVRGKNFGSPTIPWYLSGGIAAANCLAAFQPKGAASLAASYVNLVTPGVNDAAAGTAPGFDTSYGWGFTAASSQYLTVGSGALVSGVPLTMVVLFQSANVTSDFALASICRNATSNERFLIYLNGSVTGDPLNAYTSQAGTGFEAKSSSGYTASNWFTGIAVFSATNARAIYLNGSAKGTNTSSSTPQSLNATYIGCWDSAGTKGGYLGGKIAACAFYNTALNDAQVLALHTAMAALVA